MDLNTAVSALSEAPSDAASSASSGAPLKVAVILGSNREGRFGPVVASWFLGRAAGHPDVVTELIDVAETEPPATGAALWPPGWHAPTPSSS